MSFEFEGGVQSFLLVPACVKLELLPEILVSVFVVVNSLGNRAERRSLQAGKQAQTIAMFDSIIVHKEDSISSTQTVRLESELGQFGL